MPFKMIFGISFKLWEICKLLPINFIQTLKGEWKKSLGYFKFPSFSSNIFIRFACLVSLNHPWEWQRRENLNAKQLSEASFVSGWSRKEKKTRWTAIKLNSEGSKKEKIISIMAVMTLDVVWEIIKIYASLSFCGRSFDSEL